MGAKVVLAEIKLLNNCERYDRERYIKFNDIHRLSTWVTLWQTSEQTSVQMN